MGDNLFLPRLADFQPASGGRKQSPSTPAPAIEPAETANGDDEDYTIRCVCDFTDDDGNTVLCEHCNTWQHIICYYFPRESLDDDFHHSCVICNPRHVDSHQANTLQHRRRDPVVAEEKKVRKERAQKQKRSKAHLTNGIGDHTRSDGRDASPRDGAPPAKRPKTNHRHSGSVASAIGPQRSRAMSMVKRRPHLSELPSDYFSADFFQAQLDQHSFRPSTANLHLNIGITNTLSRWLDDEDEFYKATSGKTHQDVFMHLSQPMEELEVPVQKHIETHPEIEFNGQHPMWHKLKATRDITTGEFVGELCGSIGLQKDYVSDPTNKWNKLRHPDHFVFFHPMLPIFIDCRTEGTVLRFARRSCHPSVRISTLITGAREYRFCFTAKHDIAEGAEITVGWDSDPRLSDQSEGRQPMTASVRDEFSSRAEALLSHFGGCACDVEHCLMLHFDRRIREQPDTLDQNLDSMKGMRNGTKKRKSAKKSPSEPNQISRASSEAITHADADEEIDDARSTSQSTKQSRDNTPSAGLLGSAELTAREKRKLMQSEKLFEQMEAPKRKKRNSGSNPSVVVDALGVRTVVKRVNASNPNTPIASKPRTGNGIPHVREGARSTSDNASPVSTLGSARSTVESPNGQSRNAPLYRDNSTQTVAVSDASALRPRQPRRPFLSLSRRLMKRSLTSWQQPKSDVSNATATVSIADQAQNTHTSAALDTSYPFASPSHHDIDMKGPSPPITAHESEIAPVVSGSEIPISGQGGDSDVQRGLPPSIDTLDAPTMKHLGSEDKENKDARAISGLHVDLPPTVIGETTTDPMETRAPDPSSMTSAPAQSLPVPRRSPTTPGAFFSTPLDGPRQSPPIPSVARPSPVKKKMSLSDYLSKRKAAETPVLARIPSDVPGALDKDVVKEE